MMTKDDAIQHQDSDAVRRARTAVLSIIEDLADRRGLGHAWTATDSSVRASIEEEWVQIVLRNVFRS